MKNDQRTKNLPAFLRNQQGSTVLIIALMLPVFLGFTALAVDVGQMMAVKAQLNNAAEAGALSGARSLSLIRRSTTEYAISLNWSYAISTANNTVQKNSADGAALSATSVPGGLLEYQLDCQHQLRPISAVIWIRRRISPTPPTRSRRSR